MTGVQTCALPISSPSPSPLIYRATATAIHASVPRTDGAIAVGDTLQLKAWAPDGAGFVRCAFRIVTEGGWLMAAHGRVESGVCALDLVVPMPRGPRDATHGRARLDLCVAADLAFDDGTASGTTRALLLTDRLAPGGVACSVGVAAGDEEVLDLALDTSGTPAPFTSDPPLLSWDIADWDPGYAPLRFGTPWTVHLPAWVVRCEPPRLNGSWTTSLTLDGPASGCPTWSLRLPGVLPATMPWDGGPGDWDVEIIVDYGAGSQATDRTIATERVPYEPASGGLTSTFDAVFPADLATARFVNVGSSWSPVFLVTAADATECWIEMSPA